MKFIGRGGGFFLLENNPIMAHKTCFAMRSVLRASSAIRFVSPSGSAFRAMVALDR